jgi:hypothetical protein
MFAVSGTCQADDARSDTESDSGHETDRLADLVRQLTERLAEQTAIAAMWQERARILSERLALEAPPAPGAPLAAPGAPDPPNLTPGPLAESGPIRGPWWRRWLLAISG